MSTDQAFQDALQIELAYQRLQLDPERGFEAWVDQFETARDAVDFELGRSLLALVRREALQPSQVSMLRQCEGLLLSDLGQFGAAEVAYASALCLAEEAGDQPLATRILHNQGLLLKQQGRWEAAIQCYWRRLAALEPLGSAYLRPRAETLVNLGAAYEKKWALEEAEQCYQEALEIFQAHHAEHDVAITLSNLGIVALNREQNDEAQRRLEASREIFQRVGDRMRESEALTNLAIMHRENGQYTEAIQCLEASLAIKQAYRAVRGVATVLNNLGMVHRAVGTVGKARDAYMEAHLTFQEIGDNFGAATTLFNLARLELESGRLVEFHAQMAQLTPVLKAYDLAEIAAGGDHLEAQAALAERRYADIFHHLAQSLAHASRAGMTVTDQVSRRLQHFLVEAYNSDENFCLEFVEPLVEFWEGQGWDSEILADVCSRLGALRQE
jgi:tetratricopeptide (TPR) repeat protein